MPTPQPFVVLVTGASSGIGLSTARRFTKEGYLVIAAARRTEPLDQLAKEFPEKVRPIQLDVRNRDQIAKQIAGLPDPWSNIDLLVNNAGLGRGLDKLQQGKPDDWDEMIDTNIKGLLNVTRAVVPGMIERGCGHIINIGSIAGHEVYPAGNVYCATKHAVDALTKGLRFDLVDTPLRVSTVDPGLVETEFSQVRFRGDTDRAKKVYQGFTPLHPDDIADAVYWIATRPAHVQIAEIIILPTAQASAMVTHKLPVT